MTTSLFGTCVRNCLLSAIGAYIMRVTADS